MCVALGYDGPSLAIDVDNVTLQLRPMTLDYMFQSSFYSGNYHSSTFYSFNPVSLTLHPCSYFLLALILSQIFAHRSKVRLLNRRHQSDLYVNNKVIDTLVDDPRHYYVSHFKCFRMLFGEFHILILNNFCYILI